MADRPEGTRRVYYIDPKGLADIRRWLDRFWDDALDAFRAEAERDDENETETDSEGEGEKS